MPLEAAKVSSKERNARSLIVGGMQQLWQGKVAKTMALDKSADSGLNACVGVSVSKLLLKELRSGGTSKELIQAARAVRL